jgi:predicted metal-dependent HD superfamily phosphohydrolase
MAESESRTRATVQMQRHWEQLAASVGLDGADSRRIWGIILDKYSENHRYYHTLEHIQDMVQKRLDIADLISDKTLTDLAIFFHDIIYDPKSKVNEEESANLFRSIFQATENGVDVPKICNFILQTKYHEVLDSTEEDLKLFIDMDMSILGSHPNDYRTYAMNIRREYSHMNDADFCSGRGRFLGEMLNEARFIFASDHYRIHLEEKAKANIRWECGFLLAGDIVS